MTNAAIRAQEARDLRGQLGDLEGNDPSEMLITDTSPARRWVPVYSNETGEMIPVMQYHLPEVMQKRLPNGRPAFNAHGYDCQCDRGCSPSQRAPEPRLGTTLCFMARDSEYRETLNMLGITKVCHAEHLQNNFAAERHATKSHKDEWRTLQAFLEAEEKRQDRERQDSQIQAMLKLAERPRVGRPPKEDE